MSETATLPAYADGEMLKVWCEHEGTWHHHGLGNGSGHRIAHCTCEASPFAKTGYTLELVPGPAPKHRCGSDSRCRTCRKSR